MLIVLSLSRQLSNCAISRLEHRLLWKLHLQTLQRCSKVLAQHTGSGRTRVGLLDVYEKYLVGREWLHFGENCVVVLDVVLMFGGLGRFLFHSTILLPLHVVCRACRNGPLVPVLYSWYGGRLTKGPVFVRSHNVLQLRRADFAMTSRLCTFL